MLVLTRRSQESIVVGDSSGFEPFFKVTVLEIHGTKVRLGFEADKGVIIHRAEVWDRLRANGSPSPGPA